MAQDGCIPEGVPGEGLDGLPDLIESPREQHCRVVRI